MISAAHTISEDDTISRIMVKKTIKAKHFFPMGDSPDYSKQL